MVIIYHPGYPPGLPMKSQSSDVVSCLNGDLSTVERMSARFAQEELDYYEVARCSDMDEANEYVAQHNLRWL